MKIGLTNIVSCKIGSTQVNRVYIGSTLIWSYSAFDPDAQLFITNAAITDPTQQSAINGLVTNLKNYGIWTKMKAIYPFIGGVASSHKFNLRNPLDTDAAFRLVFNGGATHDSTGITGNGVNAYANTFLNDTALSIDNKHIAIYQRNILSNLSGAQVGLTPANRFYLNYQGTNYSNIGMNVPVTTVTAPQRGMFLLSKVSNGAYKYYQNSLTPISKTGTNFAQSTNHFILAQNNGTAAVDHSLTNLSLVSFGDGLSDTEAANYYTAVQTFQTKLLRQVGVPIVSDSDAQAFLNAAVITDVTQASAVNTLVTDLKGYGIWTKMKALYPFVGGTASQHKFNLKNPLDTDAAFRLVFSGGWTHSSTGALPNGTNAYADTFFVPLNNGLTTSNAHVSFYGRTSSTTTGVEIGNYVLNPAGTAYSGIILQGISSSNQVRFYYSLGLRAFKAVTSAPTGLVLGTSIINSRRDLFVNGISIANNIQSDTSVMPNSPLYIGAYATGTPSTAAAFTDAQQALASIGDGLTNTEVANYYTAVQAFQTTLNRQV